MGASTGATLISNTTASARTQFAARCRDAMVGCILQTASSTSTVPTRTAIWSALRSILALTLCWGIFFTPSFPAGRDPLPFLRQARMWRLDLRLLGYDGYAPSPADFSAPTLTGLSFSPSGTLLVSFLTQAEPGGLRTRSKIGDNFRLHILEVNPHDGVVLSAAVVPVESYLVDVIAALDGRFVVIAGSHLALYSATGVLESSRDLGVPGGQSTELGGVRAASDGGSFVAVYDRAGVSFWVATTSLRTIASTRGQVSAVADNLLAVRLFGRFSSLDAVVARLGGKDPCDGRSFGQPIFPARDAREQEVQVTAVCNRAGELVGTLGGQAGRVGRVRFHVRGTDTLEGPFFGKFLGDTRALLYKDDGYAIGIYTTSDWREIASWKYDHTRGDQVVLPAAGGSCFAILEWGGRSVPALDVYGSRQLKSVSLYDVESRRVSVSRAASVVRRFEGASLSPNGSVLALMAGGVVEAYRSPMAAR